MIAYLPASGDRHQTVFLDAGHGGLDPGPAPEGFGWREASCQVVMSGYGIVKWDSRWAYSS
jgi:hypothetical protein